MSRAFEALRGKREGYLVVDNTVIPVSLMYVEQNYGEPLRICALAIEDHTSVGRVREFREKLRRLYGGCTLIPQALGPIKPPKIKNVIFNDPATIVVYDDGTKTVVKCQPGDTYDAEKGLALCIAKKYFGNKGNFNEVFKKWVPETPEVKEKDGDIEPYTGLKYGTRIYIVRTKNGCLGAERHTGYITQERSHNGLLNTDPGYNVKVDFKGHVWRINPDAKIEILKEV